jgi:uncharacterized membrane protein
VADHSQAAGQIEQARPPSVSVSARPRLESIDLLRGLIMVLMALDHARDFFTNVKFDPLDLTQTNPALFLTRWITHFCAPNFILLAGVAAFLTRTRGRTTRELSWFLFSRGLWLAFLEVSWVRCLGWEFNFDYHNVGVGVLWAIGWGMVALSVLVWLPSGVVGIFGVLMICLHNLFDAVAPEAFGKLGWLWAVLHVSTGLHPAPGFNFAIGYPLVPWMGVLAAGYGFGKIFLLDAAKRQRWMRLLGLSLIVLFVVIRALNGYGNPRPWQPQSNLLFTIFAFIDVHKYPPSLDYLLITIGPALVLLSYLDKGTPRLLRPLLAFGRVPLFYYLLHLPLLHGVAVVAAWIRFGRVGWMFASPFAPPTAETTPPPNHGFDLPIVYLVWIVAVLALYPVCHWFADFKARRKGAWLSYL